MTEVRVAEKELHPGAEPSAAAHRTSPADAATANGPPRLNPVATTARSGQVAERPMTGEVLPPKRKSKRRMLLPLALLGVIGVGGDVGYRYLTDWQYIVSTDDSYVKAPTSIIAAKLSGYISTVPVVENTRVAAGDVLARIDDGDYRLAVRAAKDKIATQDATIARLGEQARAQAAVVAQAQAQVLAAEADSIRAAAAFERSNALARNQYATKATLDQARADKDRTAAAVASAQAAVESAKANVAVLRAQKAEAVRAGGELETALARAQRDLDFTVIKAPFAGVVGNKAAQPGQFVMAGTRLMALVPLDSVYVEANFKETQLARMKAGQTAEITVDAYGGRKVDGIVESFAPASGSEFSLLPPENATGNFTKIVQRVPVRIQVPEDVARQGILRPGLSVGVAVHTRDERSPKPTLLSALGRDRVDPIRTGSGSGRADAEPAGPGVATPAGAQP